MGMLRRLVTGRAARHSGWKCLLAGALVMLGATAATAQTNRYNTDRFVASTRNECTDAPGCVTFQQTTIGVPPGRRASARFACPATHPHLWGWDVALHEHVGVTLVAADRDTVTVEGVSKADAAGSFIVFLGCSGVQRNGTTFMNSRQILPTGSVAAKVQ
jgi:hypothetical protein